MALTTEQAARLADLDAKLGAGIRTVTLDTGRSVTYDLEAMERERDALRALQAGVPAGSRFRRAVFTSHG